MSSSLHQFFATTLSTSDGPFSVVGTHEHVLASGWTDDPASLVALIHPKLRPAADQIVSVAPDELSLSDEYHESAMRLAVDAALAYYRGNAALLSSVPVLQHSGPFRQHAWEVLRTVEPGNTVTYSEYALKSGNAAAFRAAASACAMNAAALFVPCHRVLRTDGSLGGFRYGLGIKESLLGRERSLR